MKLIRWILSNLILIVIVLSLVYVYVYWDDLAGEDTPAGKIIASLSEEYAAIGDFVATIRAKNSAGVTATSEVETEEHASSSAAETLATTQHDAMHDAALQVDAAPPAADRYYDTPAAAVTQHRDNYYKAPPATATPPSGNYYNAPAAAAAQPPGNYYTAPPARAPQQSAANAYRAPAAAPAASSPPKAADTADVADAADAANAAEVAEVAEPSAASEAPQPGADEASAEDRFVSPEIEQALNRVAGNGKLTADIRGADMHSPSAADTAQPAVAATAPAAAAQSMPGAEQAAEQATASARAVQPVSGIDAQTRALWLDARRAFLKRDYETCERNYEQLIAANKDNMDAYGELGNVYFNQGKREQAAAAYYEAAAIMVKQGQVRRAASLSVLLRHLDQSRALQLKTLLDSAVQPSS